MLYYKMSVIDRLKKVFGGLVHLLFICSLCVSGADTNFKRPKGGKSHFFIHAERYLYHRIGAKDILNINHSICKLFLMNVGVGDMVRMPKTPVAQPEWL